MECEHITERIEGEIPQCHDKDGKEFFATYQLRCKKCKVKLTELLGMSEKEINEEKERQQKYGKDWYPVKKLDN